MNISQVIIQATEQLAIYLNNQTSAAQEARWLLAHLLNVESSTLLAHSKRELSEVELSAYTALLDGRIRRHKPLAYILGTAPFCELTIKVRPPFLIPRHETEELVMHLVALLKPYRNLCILDLCTGTGAIALALARHLPDATIVGSDISAEALTLAEENRQALGLQNISFIRSDLYEHIPQRFFDLIISNPPYLSQQEWEELPPDVKEWESPLALVGGDDGFAAYETIISNAHKHLTGRFTGTEIPQLVLEHGAEQQQGLEQYLHAAGFTSNVLWKDSFGKDRAILAR
ncbi:MAG: release factor glutamine methyltransferase [Candidatus Dependentiae bacterium]|nr:release factor glutamine methyltransferase [Candidatus Dependentiae bacterium]